MTDPARAVVFGDDANAYETSRPSYPREAVDRVAGLIDASVAVEIGAGTGKATVDIARPGLRLICLEPSHGMAVVLGGKELPGVEVVVTTFEKWPGAGVPVDLIYAAQSWHWVDPAAGYERAKSLLRPGGYLALMWNIPADRYTDFRDTYERHAPHLLAENDERIERRDSHDWRVDMAEAGFVDLDLFAHEWDAELSAAEFRSLYSTYSDHMLLPEPARTTLLDDLERAVTDRGGSVVLHYRTVVFSGRA